MPLQRHLRIVSCGTEEPTMENALKIAFASSDSKTVNQHFGSAKAFVIYLVDTDNAQLQSVAQFEEFAQDGNEDKLTEKFKLLEGCAAVYCQAVGGSAIKQLMAYGIQPVKVSEGADIKELIEALQEELKSNPTAWVAKAVQKKQQKSADRFDSMEAEGWAE